MKDYYTLKQLAEMLGVPYRTLQNHITKRSTWSTFLERNGYNGKSKEYFLRLLEKNREHANYIKEHDAKVKSRKRDGKFFGSFTKESANVIARQQKEEELRQIEERIAKLEAEMAAVVFDRDINSQLQALYIKRKCAREWLGIKDGVIIDSFAL